MRSKLLPGAVARIVFALNGDEHTGLLILPGMNANPRPLSHLRVGAVSPNHQLCQQRLVIFKHQLMLMTMSVHCFEHRRGAQGDLRMSLQRIPQRAL